MKELAVVDSTSLIGLERIGRLELLPAIFAPVLAPPEVEREFGRSLPWLVVEAPGDPALVSALELVVDCGEAEAIALARKRQCRVVLDDRKARSAARHLGLPVIGTIGALVIARNSGVVSSLRQVLDELEQSGFYVSARLRREALDLVGELSEEP